MGHGGTGALPVCARARALAWARQGRGGSRRHPPTHTGQSQGATTAAPQEPSSATTLPGACALGVYVRACVGLMPAGGGRVRSRESYNNIANWLADARSLASPDIVIILVGNKVDLERDRQVRRPPPSPPTRTHNNTTPQHHRLGPHDSTTRALSATSDESQHKGPLRLYTTSAECLSIHTHTHTNDLRRVQGLGQRLWTQRCG
jgi:hypothetical protein